jgi:acetyltransferase-like isoleucine patch superfamily enzyme
MRTLLRSLLFSLRRTAHRWRGIEVDATCVLGPHLWLRRGFREDHKGRIKLGPRCQLDPGTVIEAFGGSVVLGENVFIGPHAVIYGHGCVEIGDDTLVSMHCRILSSNHTIPVAERRIRWEPDVLLPTKIGRDVWLGAGVTVLGGVTIGDGCVVGAGAVVTRDLPPSSIAWGVPARVTGQRSTAKPTPS